MRVLFAALALCVLSFAAGVAGDLSIAAQSPPSVVLRLPPPIPAGAVRAHPLPPLTTARAAWAVEVVQSTVRRARVHLIVARVKPQTEQTFVAAKINLDLAPKDDGLVSAQI